ncbi:hypothetical protein [Glutamicibacter protophormiae]|uniref:hypothetical protein n=1 Tax=Glutamicibacter protophormiae TaxID=37930 RepID=UPI0033291D9D
MNFGFLAPWPLNADLTSYWTMWGTIATAAATVALAVFAVLAWRAALRTIETQTNSDQIAALAEYVKSLNSLSRVTLFKYDKLHPAQYSFTDHQDSLSEYRSMLSNMAQQVESTATIWRAHHKTVGGEMAAFAEAEFFLIESIEWWRSKKSDVPADVVREQHALWADFAKDLSRYATTWQVNDKDRSKTAGHVRGKLDRYLHESPLISDDFSSYEVFPMKTN